LYRKSFFYTRDYSALLIILAAYFLFALSDVIQIGEYRITLSHTTSGIWGVFRSSGRFIWPVFYFIQFFVLIEIYDSFSFSKSKRNIILSVLLLLQVLDNSYLIEKVRSSWLMPDATLSYSRENPIKNDFWFNLKKYHIQHLFIMDDIKSQDLKVMFTYVAFRNHITINDAYLARSASKRKNAYYQSQLDDFLTGKLLPNTLYIGLENKNIYPKKYCVLLDGYTVCSDNISLIFSLKSKH